MEDILRAYAVLFWFNFYLRCPDFPITDGMFPLQPDVRRTYLQVQSKVFAHWATAANRIGISTARFREACATVRAPWIGPGDPLRKCRSRAGVLAGCPQLDLD
ncbi:hypothetical protein [Ralstonia soli]|uniref:Transposase n=1 Tax=Ralstonia soli TaxID=2953896 RepID=A0ABT1AKB9_9RALS|nr:hypothetical protein [Ralstonia soli]MCO5398865.1 hypothetical protein [Ralstonia soli]